MMVSYPIALFQGRLFINGLPVLSVYILWSVADNPFLKQSLVYTDEYRKRFANSNLRHLKYKMDRKTPYCRDSKFKVVLD